MGTKLNGRMTVSHLKRSKLEQKVKKKYSKMFLCYSLIFGQFVTVRFLCVAVSFWTVSDCIIAQS